MTSNSGGAWEPLDWSDLIGTMGGVLTGAATGFFSPSRIPTPINTPIPDPHLPGVQVVLRSSLIAGSTLWRITKRGFLGAVLFSILEHNDDNRPVTWGDSLYSGVLTGGVFGLRGGLKGIAIGSGIFTVLVGVRELCSEKKKRERNPWLEQIKRRK